MSNCRRSTLTHRGSTHTVSFVQTPNRLGAKLISESNVVNPEKEHVQSTGADKLKTLLTYRASYLPATVQTCKATQLTSVSMALQQETFPNLQERSNKIYNAQTAQGNCSLQRLACKNMMPRDTPPDVWKETNVAHCSVGLSLLTGLHKDTDAVSFLQCRVDEKTSTHREEWIHNLVYLSLYFEIGKISFRKCSFDGYLAEAVCDKLPNLFELDLSNQLCDSGLNKIGDEAATNIANRLPKLRVLKLVDSGLTDWSGVEIGCRLTDLRELCLSTRLNDVDNNSFGYATANAIAENLTELRYLYLPDNQITDQGCMELAASLSNLLRLWVRGNRIGKMAELLTRSLLSHNSQLTI